MFNHLRKQFLLGLLTNLVLFLSFSLFISNSALAQTAPVTPKTGDTTSSVPSYPGLIKLSLDKADLSTLEIDNSQFQLEAGLTPDGVSKVVDFYIGKLKEQGYASPEKAFLTQDGQGQTLTYQNGKLIILVINKTTLNILPPFKALNQKVPNGQTVVLFLIQKEISSAEGGTECKAGVECQVGEYKVQVNFDRTDFNTTDQFVATVERLDKAQGNWQLGAEVIPDKNTSATSVPFKGDFESGSSRRRQVTLNFPVSGNWYVYFTIKNSAGSGAARLYLPVQVAAPPKLDLGIAWAIGLSPLLGILGFAVYQWRSVSKEKCEELLQQQT